MPNPDPLHVPETVVLLPSRKRTGLALALLSALVMLALAAGVWWWLGGR
jgi:L-amino acid N-acyltransferase YncA